MKSIMSNVMRTKLALWSLVGLFVMCFCVVGMAQNTEGLPTSIDFTSVAGFVKSVGAYLGALVAIVIGSIPAVNKWAGTEKGMKALRIGLAALPVLLAIFIFGFKGDVIKALWEVVLSIIGGVGFHALAIKPILIKSESDIKY